MFRNYRPRAVQRTRNARVTGLLHNAVSLFLMIPKHHINGSRAGRSVVIRTDGTEPATLLRQYAYSRAVIR